MIRSAGCQRAIVFFKRCLAVLFLSLFLHSCNDNREVDDIMQKHSAFPTEQGEVVEILYTDSGLVRIRITAPEMNHYTINVPEPYTEMPKGVYIEFFNDSSQIKTTLKADYGIRYEKNKRTEVRQNVVVVNLAGEVLNTQKLNWDEALHKIYSDVAVSIKTKNDVLRGSGMTANEDFTEWEMRDPVGSKEVEETEKK
jgi:LPS export ABC transporter protein LptC